uniref:Uncharacterized protein n=1 Tax=Lygus hesperus TaxID=30085 RepID=A0A146L879_LYGHE
MHPIRSYQPSSVAKPLTTSCVSNASHMRQRPTSITRNVPSNVNSTPTSALARKQVLSNGNRIPSHLRSTQASIAKHHERPTPVSNNKPIKACTVLGGYGSHASVYNKKHRT